MKKVVIYLPSNNGDEKQRTGFFTKKEIMELENLLDQDKKIKFLGNIDFNKIHIIDKKIIYQDKDLSSVDLFFWHAPHMLKNMRLIQILAQHTKVIKHPTAFEVVSDKFYAHSLLKKNGIPVADFALISYDNTYAMKDIIKKWKTILIKPRLGSYGRGIIKVDNYETLRDIAGILKFESAQDHIFVERYYENNPKEWISTTLINGKVIYGYRKSEKKFADWKVFDIYRQGGSAYYIDPKPVKKYAEKACRILGDNSIVGFDFIKTKLGYILIDENNFPGLYPECFEEIKTSIPLFILQTIKNNL